MRAAGHLFTAAEEAHMVGLAIVMFIALFGWGSNFLGWDDPDGKVQLALFTAFILGIISGYRAKSDSGGAG
jgi:uncharacterized membrane protein YjjB (DUF3815 family)